MNQDLSYLYRTVQLAALADNRVLDNPRVGSVLVYDGSIIGEGYHQQSGRAHAEVNCLKSVRPELRELIPRSTLYVTLEPCCIIGKTGACSTLILQHGIKTVVFGQRDSTPGVDGSSATLLRGAGVEVREYPGFAPAWSAYRYRHTLVTQHRPHVTLKFAQSSDGFLRPGDKTETYWITNPISRRLVHKWRTETTAILVGARTVLDDDPQLNSRLYPGPNPIPVVLDPKGLLDGTHRVFQGPTASMLFTSNPAIHLPYGETHRIPRNLDPTTIQRILTQLATRRHGNITVEGGAGVLTAFLSSGNWDEARVFTGSKTFGSGLPAPIITRYGGNRIASEQIGSDHLEHWVRRTQNDLAPAKQRE